MGDPGLCLGRVRGDFEVDAQALRVVYNAWSAVVGLGQPTQLVPLRSVLPQRCLGCIRLPQAGRKTESYDDHSGLRFPTLETVCSQGTATPPVGWILGKIFHSHKP